MSDGEWRARFAPRPVRLRPVETLLSDAVHLHLQHPLSQRAVSPFLAQAFTEEGLARVTVVVDRSSARRRVILLGRLAVFGTGASRLHEEVFGVAAYRPDDNDPEKLEPFVTEEANERAVEAFLRVLDEPEVPALSKEITQKLLHAAPGDTRALEPVLRRRALTRSELARNRLQARGRAEADAMRAVLTAQRERIRTALEGTQVAINFEAPALDPEARERQRREQQAQLHQWEEVRTGAEELLPHPVHLHAGDERSLLRSIGLEGGYLDLLTAALAGVAVSLAVTMAALWWL